jgi:hypothetical protein
VRALRALALSALAASLLVSQAHAADTGTLALLTEKAIAARHFTEALLIAAYKQQPALVLALSTLLAVPGLAMVALLTQGVMRAATWRRRKWAPRTSSEIVIRDPRPVTGVPAWPSQAWLKVEGDGASVPISAEIVSIGRHEDNVVHLGDTSVHRFHAIIHRSDDAHFIITDVSGEDGNGVRINGERRQHARLADGDCIELGRSRLTFAAVPH